MIIIYTTLHRLCGVIHSIAVQNKPITMKKNGYSSSEIQARDYNYTCLNECIQLFVNMSLFNLIEYMFSTVSEKIHNRRNNTKRKCEGKINMGRIYITVEVWI